MLFWKYDALLVSEFFKCCSAFFSAFTFPSLISSKSSHAYDDSVFSPFSWERVFVPSSITSNHQLTNSETPRHLWSIEWVPPRKSYNFWRRYSLSAGSGSKEKLMDIKHFNESHDSHQQLVLFHRSDWIIVIQVTPQISWPASGTGSPVLVVKGGWWARSIRGQLRWTMYMTILGGTC